MIAHIFPTDEKCPNCKVDIYDALASRVNEDGATKFELECPSCATMLVISVDIIPSFTIRTPEMCEPPEFPVYYDAQGNEHQEF